MKQLTTIESLSPAEIYSPERVDAILSAIADEAKSFKADTESASGRKEIASLAYKIAQSKTFMDDCGKKLGEDAKKTLDTINAERKKIRDTLDDLKEEVRKPLTDWEEKEKKRIDDHKHRLSNLKNSSEHTSENWQIMPQQAMSEMLSYVNTMRPINWEEFTVEAEGAIKLAFEKVTNAIDRRNQYDDQQAELVKLREEKLAREKEEFARQEKDRKEAAAKAEADFKAKEAERLAAREKQLAIEKEAAIKREKEIADQRVKDAELKAKRDQELAVEKERQRADLEKKAAADAETKRQANLKHRAKINNEVLKALSAQGFDEDQGKKIITAIVSGMVPHTKINY